MADFSSMLTFAPELISNMPLIFQTIQIISYTFFVLFFGSIVVKGFRGYLPWHMKLLARIGFGFVALVCAVALAPFLPLQGTGVFNFIFSLAQIDLWVAGIISAAILTVSVYLASDKFYNINGMEKSLDKMKMKLDKAKSVEKDMAGKSMREKLMQPMRIAGIAVLAAFLIFALISFRGFPDPTARVLSSIGLTQQDLSNLQGYMQAVSPNQTVPDGCVSPLELAQNFQQAIISNELPIYADSGITNLIQANANESVAIVYRVEYKGRVYALAITEKQSICSATGTQFCGCLNLGTIGA